MSHKLLTNLDLNHNQLINALVENLAVAPESPQVGQIYFNTQESKFKVYDGQTWQTLNDDISADSIVETINKSQALIDKDNINGLTEMIDNVSMSGTDILSAINAEDSDGTIKQDKVEGLSKALASKEPKGEAKKQSDNALDGAKKYADEKIQELVGLASSEGDPLKELEDLIKANKNDLKELSAVARKYSEEIGDGVATEITVNHNLNSKDVVVSVAESKSPYSVVLTDVEITDENSVLIRTSKPVESKALRVTVIG